MGGDWVVVVFSGGDWVDVVVFSGGDMVDVVVFSGGDWVIVVVFSDADMVVDRLLGVVSVNKYYQFGINSPIVIYVLAYTIS